MPTRSVQDDRTGTLIIRGWSLRQIWLLLILLLLQVAALILLLLFKLSDSIKSFAPFNAISYEIGAPRITKVLSGCTFNGIDCERVSRVGLWEDKLGSVDGRSPWSELYKPLASLTYKPNSVEDADADEGANDEDELIKGDRDVDISYMWEKFGSGALLLLL